MSEQDYYQLNPETVLSAVESCDLQLDGSLLALNSYENRVYRLADVDGNRFVAKFYRPGRWTDEQILEEHQFASQLAELEIPVVAPMAFGGQTLLSWLGFRFTLFPCVSGREPDLESTEHLQQLGRYLGRIHALGATELFHFRPTLDVTTYGEQSIETILQSDQLPADLLPAYEAIARQLLDMILVRYEVYQPDWSIRIHADFHPGNILWSQNGPYLVDLDDARNGPAIQDLWMLVGADPEHQASRFDDLLSGYEEFREFPLAQVQLIEPLRALRMLHYCAWLARRWQDPSFQYHFPWFADSKYWEQQILQLKEQLSLLHDDSTRDRILAYY